MNDGWIKLHRCLLDNPIVCKDGDHIAVWIYLLLNATHKNYPAIFKGKKIELQPGQLITGRKSISDTLGINETKVRRILDAFENDQQIDRQRSNKNSLISIVNWGKYQNFDQQDDQLPTNKRPASDHKQECKNDKNIYISDFEDIWKLYPNKKGKTAARNSYTKLRRKFTKEELLRTVERYSLIVKDSDIQFIKHGSTFFNSGYEDYLDSNYRDNNLNNYSQKPFMAEI